MQGPSEGRSQLDSQLNNAGPPPRPKLGERVHMNRAAHEDLHQDPRVLRWTSGSATLSTGETSLRHPWRRQRHLAQFWWGVETADSANDLVCNILIDGVIQSSATLTAGDTESQIVLFDWYVNEGTVVTLELTGTPTDVTGPWWFEVDVDEAFL